MKWSSTKAAPFDIGVFEEAGHKDLVPMFTVQQYKQGRACGQLLLSISELMEIHRLTHRLFSQSSKRRELIKLNGKIHEP